MLFLVFLIAWAKLIFMREKISLKSSNELYVPFSPVPVRIFFLLNTETKFQKHMWKENFNP